MWEIAVKHWYVRSGGKVISGLLIGVGILLMVLATFLHKSTLGVILGLALLVMGILIVLLADRADRHLRKR